MECDRETSVQYNYFIFIYIFITIFGIQPNKQHMYSL